MKWWRLFLYYKERLWPLLLGVLTGYLFYKYQIKINDLPGFIDKLLNTTLSVSGTLLGFLLTILTIMNSINTRRMHFVRTGGGLNSLNRYLKWALWFDLLSITIFFIFPLAITQPYFSDYKIQLYTGLVSIIAFTWFLNIRFALIFIKLLTDPQDQ